MPFDFTPRSSRREVVLELNPHQILVAEITRPNRGRVLLEAAAEFGRDDYKGLNRWLRPRPWARAICSLVPRRSILQRQTLHAPRLTEPGYLAAVIEEQQKGQFLSSTPFKLVDPEEWTLRAVNASKGTPLAADTEWQTGVICGMANEELQEAQQRLVEARLLPDRVEAGLLSLFGSIYQQFERRRETRAAAVVVVQQAATTVYILGREGIHTPNPIFHGFGSIGEVTRKEFGLKDEAEARRMINSSDPFVMQRADRLVRRIGRDLVPLFDSYEMSTGQPLDEIFCAYLSPKLSWVGDALAKATGRTAMQLDYKEWMTTAGVQLSEGVPALGPHWLGALSLIGNQPATSRKRINGDAAVYHRSWHVDYKLPAISAERRAASRRFLTATGAGALLAFSVALTVWQIYASKTLRDDLHYWERQLTTNRKLFEELTASNARLQTQSVALRQAYDLMAAPFQLSDFVVNLSRTVPPRTRVDRIETNDKRVAVSGLLFEPAEEATNTLGRYLDELRANPAIGPLFASIAITSLQRKTEGSDAVLFEITLRLKEATP